MSIPMNDLRKIAHQYGFKGRTKHELAGKLFDHYSKLKKWVHYTFIKQLGTQGRDGRTFLVRHDNGNEYAMKVFSPDKKPTSIQKEVDLQMIAAKEGVAPKIVDYDVDGRFIVMEKLDMTLYDFFLKQNGTLTIPQQKEIVRVFRRLDRCGVFHNDPNPLNLMKKGRKWYMIDYGLSKPINESVIRRWGTTPNESFMTIGIVAQFKSITKDCSFDYLESLF